MSKDPSTKTPANFISEYNVVPNPILEEKFVNIFRDTVQVKKFVTFDLPHDIIDPDLQERCRPFFTNFSEDDPWVKSRRANSERDEKVLDYWLTHREEC